MPTKARTVTYYKCNVCSNEFESQEAALDCEKQGYALPELFEGMVVTVSIKDKKYGTTGIIYEEAFDRETGDFDPHRLSYYYEVLMKDPQTQAKSSPHWISIDLPVTAMQLIAGFKGDVCPICQGINIKAHVKEHYRPYCAPHLEFPKMDMLKCQDCRAKFFSERQVSSVKKVIFLEAKKQNLLLANQKKLQREQNYYFGL